MTVVVAGFNKLHIVKINVLILRSNCSARLNYFDEIYGKGNILCINSIVKLKPFSNLVRHLSLVLYAFLYHSLRLALLEG